MQKVNRGKSLAHGFSVMESGQMVFWLLARKKDTMYVFPAAYIYYINNRTPGKRMYRMNKTDSRHMSWLYLYLGGFLAGVFIINIWRNLFLQNMELLNAASLNRLQYLEVDRGAFFLYVVKERIGIVVILGVLATTYIGIYVVSMFAVWTGAMAGILLSVASIRYGIKGIAFILAGTLPQYLLLVPACIMLMDWCYKLSTALYHPEKAYDMKYSTKKQYILRKAVQLLIIAGIAIAGSIVESYINPMLISFFIKIF